MGDDPGPFAQLRQWGLRNPGRLAVLQSVFWTLVVLGWLAVVDFVIGAGVLNPVSLVTMPVAGAVFGLVMYRLNREATAKAASKRTSSAPRLWLADPAHWSPESPWNQPEAGNV